jgi:hypothetical protein
MFGGGNIRKHHKKQQICKTIDLAIKFEKWRKTNTTMSGGVVHTYLPE